MSGMRVRRNDLEKNTIKELWKLGAPTILEQALQTAVVYVDTAMVGHISATASAAVGLTTTINWLLNGIFFSVSVGMLSFISRYTGSGEKEKAHRISAQALWVLLGLAFIETIIALWISPVLPKWMGADKEIWHDASLYFFIVSCPLLLRGASIIFGNVLRANKDSKTPMYVNVGVNLLNILLNQLLIGSETVIHTGELIIRIPGMNFGVAGAAIATAISQSLGGIILFAATMKNPLTTLKGQRKKPDWANLKDCFSVALPLMGERLVMGSGYIMFSALVAGLGTLSTAAHAIALTIEEAFYVPGYGVQTAVSTFSGNAAGKGSEEELNAVVKAGLRIAVSIMSIMSVFLFIGATGIMGVFSTDTEVIELGASVLRIVAVSEPLFAVLIIYEGVFHGIGETKIPFFFAIFTMWGIRNFMSWFLIRWFDAGLKAVWVCMVMDNVCRCILLVLLYKTKKWKKKRKVNGK